MFLLTVYLGIHAGSFLCSYVGMKLILICLTSFSSLKLRMSSNVKLFNLCCVFYFYYHLAKTLYSAENEVLEEEEESERILKFNTI